MSHNDFDMYMSFKKEKKDISKKEKFDFSSDTFDEFENIDLSDDKKINEESINYASAIYHSDWIRNMRFAPNTGKTISKTINGILYTFPEREEGKFRDNCSKLKKALNKLTKEQKLRFYECQVKSILSYEKVGEYVTNSYRKNLTDVIYKGKKYRIPKAFNDELKRYAEEIEELNRQMMDSKEVFYGYNISNEELIFANEFKTSIEESMGLKYEDFELQQQIKNKNKTNKLSKQVNEKSTDNNIVSEDVIKENLFQTGLPELTAVENEMFDSKIWLSFDEENNNLNKEEKVEDRDNKSKIKWLNRIKKKALAITAGIVAGVVALAFIPGLMGKNNKKAKQEDKDSYSISQVETNDISKEKENNEVVDVKNNADTIKQDEKYHEEEKSNDNIENIEFDRQNMLNNIDLYDYVTVNNNINIYDNVYDAKAKTNGLNPYFDGSMKRVVIGITYEFNGQIIYCDCHDNDAEEKSSLLKTAGAKVVSIMTSVDGKGYEGVYNINDVSQVVFKQSDIKQQESNQKVLK